MILQKLPRNRVLGQRGPPGHSRPTAQTLIGEGPHPEFLLAQPPEPGEAVRLDELLGTGFALVARECPLGALASETVGFLDRIGASSVAVTLESEIGRLLCPYIDDGRIVVVRPDRYVFTVADGIEDLEAALATLRKMLVLTTH